MLRSPEINEIAAALASAQAKFGPITKDKIAKINSSKGNYSYRYADIADVISAIRPALTANGIAIIQTTEPAEKGYHLDTQLVHSSGQFIGSRLLLDRWPDPKQLGIEMTYLRRYALCALAGVASDDDMDADALDQKGQKKRGATEPDEDGKNKRLGMDPELLERAIRSFGEASSADELTERYTEAYRTAKEAGDEAAMSRLLAEYRGSKHYIAPVKAIKSVT